MACFFPYIACTKNETNEKNTSINGHTIACALPFHFLV